jgi:hypothetical protein
LSLIKIYKFIQAFRKLNFSFLMPINTQRGNTIMSFNNKLALTMTLLCSSTVAYAIPFSSFDTRSMAMGGAGVAVATPDAAPLFNPALLSISKESDKFSIILPTVGVRVADPENLRDSVDNFQKGNYLNNLQNAVNAFNTAPSQTTAATVGTQVGIVSTQLATLSNKPITVDGGVATVVALPSKKLGAAFYLNATAAAGGNFLYKDKATLDKLSADATACAALDATACTAVNNFNTNNLTSGIDVKGVTLGEIGVSLSHEFTISNQVVAVGITPKIVKAKLFDTVILVNSNNQNNQNISNDTAEYSFVNFDLGAAKSYDNGWSSGFVIKNLIPQTLEFKRNLALTGESLKLSPLARLGVAHTNSWSTVAVDLDLTRNDPAGFEKATQYLALGGELNAWNWIQLRAGYRMDLVDNSRNVTSVGLGFSPFGVVHADLAVAGNANEIGASFQLGVHF